MDQQTKQAVANALDKAITVVAEDEFNRLSHGLPLSQVANEIEVALNSFRKLSDGVMPNYNEWDALFYITWYQPSQINLVYSVIKKMLSEGVSLDDKLHIVDFGCGALAMQFGVALAVADALEQGKSINAIRFELIDDSESMISIGKKVWDQFELEVCNVSDLPYLAEACKIMKSRKNISTSVKQQNWSNVCWISAIHAVYEENEEVVKQELTTLVKALSPDVCFTTTHNHAQGRNLLAKVWDPNSNNYSSDWKWGIQPQFSGNLKSITQWRTNLHRKILDIPPMIKIGENDYPIRDYLTNQVTWEWRAVATLIHTNRPIDNDDLPW